MSFIINEITKVCFTKIYFSNFKKVAKKMIMTIGFYIIMKEA